MGGVYQRSPADTTHAWRKVCVPFLSLPFCFHGLAGSRLCKATPYPTTLTERLTVLRRYCVSPPIHQPTASMRKREHGLSFDINIDFDGT